MTDAIAVTGLGIVSPIGVGPQQFWSALCAGHSGIAALDPPMDGLPPIAARVRAFAAREFITSVHYRRMDALSRMTVAACRMALDDARALPGLDLTRLGVVYGSAYGDVTESAQYLDKLFAKGAAAASPLLFPNLVHNAPASYAAMEFGAQGVNLTVSQGEVSGETAIALAAEVLRAGRADLVLAGGADELAVPVAIAMRHVRALAGQRGGRAWASPYDAARSGVVLGEGAAMLVLEPYERARRRGASIYARLDATTSTAVAAPRYDWPRDAGAAAAELGAGAPLQLVIGSANSSVRLDACELRLIDRLANARGATLTSIKGAVGEFGAAGAMSAAAACLALRHQVVPPLCNLETPAGATQVRLAAGVGQPQPIERAAVFGIARGGAVAALTFSRA
ncbi:MAG: beta-ketoacyl synthase N-terminal-like domain-containing protein [Deltaproteobacteria bacterium]|nr:beta-ketoacyl synthase N-terminal-like domain-containing protein [Deltaproteobacteria bacterium]